MKKIFSLLLICFVTAHLPAQNISLVNGIVIAPPPTSIVFQNNKTDNLSLVAKNDTGGYSQNIFYKIKIISF